MNGAQASWRWFGAAMLLAATAARADDPGRFSAIEENDGIISHKDRYYTQGFQASYLSGDLSGHANWNALFDTIGLGLPMYRDAAGVSQRRFEYIPVAQVQFTPQKIDVSTPDPKDRPYAAWLYTGLHLLQENDSRSLNNLEVLAGIIGPAAAGREVQDGYHRVVGFHQAQGWSHQIANRPGIQFSYDYKRRFVADFGSQYAFDVIPEAGLSLGWAYRYLDAGMSFRFGNALDLDYGPEHIRPSLSGTAYSDYRRLGPGWFHWYLFAGAQERSMFYNVFIDAADSVAPQGLDRAVMVTDYSGGATLIFGRWLRADFVAIRRGREFAGQNGTDNYGGVNLTIDP
jgi:lipid A 3-O-deacylase